MIPLLATALTGLLQAQQPSTSQPPSTAQRLSDLSRAKDWNGLADAFEQLSPQERGRFLHTWIEALTKAARWQRLLEVTTAVLPQLEKNPVEAMFVDELRQRQLSAMSHLGRHRDAALLGETLGDQGANYGYVYALQGARDAQDWELMARVAAKAVAKNPKNQSALSDQGEALARLGRWAEAEPALQATVQLNPKDYFAWSNLGLCRLQRKAWQEAADALDQAIALNAETPEPFANRGRARFELKRYEGSVEDYRRALAMLPGNALLAQNLAQAERYAKSNKNSK